MKKRLGLLLLSSMFVTGCFTGKRTNLEEQKVQKTTKEEFMESADILSIGVEGTDGSRYFMGAKKLDEKEFRSIQLAPNPSIGAGEPLPRKKDLSAGFPIPGNQGRQNSCVGWAVGYAYKTFQEQTDQGWNPDSKERVFSPSYVYNQINGGQDRGAQIYKAVQLVVDKGTATLELCPYTDYKTQPTQAAVEQAKHFKAKSWGRITSGNVDLIKRHLASGDGVVMGMPVYSDFVNLSPSNPIYGDTSGDLAKVHGYHAISIVGYDDDKEAFKIINSWGTNWGINGFGWVAYDFMKKEKERIELYTMVDVKEKISDDTTTNEQVPVIGSVARVEAGNDITVKGSNFSSSTIVNISGNSLNERAVIKSFTNSTITLENKYTAGTYTLRMKNAGTAWSNGIQFEITEKSLNSIPLVSIVEVKNGEIVISGENFAERGNCVYIVGGTVNEYMEIISSTSNEIKAVNRYDNGTYQILVRTETSQWSQPYYLNLY